LAAWRRPRSAPSTPTWLTTLVRSIKTFVSRTTAVDASMPSGSASRRDRLGVPVDRLATTSSSAYDPAQVLRSGGGRLTRLVELAPPPPSRPHLSGQMAASNAEEINAGCS